MVSARLSVPESIPRPDYADSGRPADRASRAVRTPDEIAAMRVAGRVAAEALIEVGRHVVPGITTDELDRIGHEAMVEAGAYPSTLNYRGYPKSLCSSVNEVISPRDPRLTTAGRRRHRQHRRDRLHRRCPRRHRRRSWWVRSTKLRSSWWQRRARRCTPA
ncbi:MAG: M24 family metallopeptidase [Microthrixaceae bacterium]